MAFWRTPRMPEERKKKPEEGRRKPPKGKPTIQRWVEELNPIYVIVAILVGFVVGDQISISTAPSEEQFQVKGVSQVAVELLTPTPTPTPVYNFAPELETEMASEVNNERTTRAMPTLELDNQLRYLARIRSSDMAVKNYFSHDPPDGCNYLCLMDSAGIAHAWVGENVAWNNGPINGAAKDMMQRLMESAEHRDNILSCHYERVGIGIVERYDGVKVYTQIFEGRIDC